MRLTRFVVTLPVSLLIVSCASVLGLRDIDDGNAPAGNDGAPGDIRADARVDARGAEGGGPTEGTDGSTGADGAPLDSGDGGATTLVDCLGTPRNVFFCDGFEAVAIATPPWTLTVNPAGATNAEFASSPNVHVTGARSAVSDVGASGGTMTARARWDRPGGSGALSFQVSVYLPNDAWTNNDTVPFAAVIAGGSRGEIVFKANGSGANGSLSLQMPPNSIDLGPVSQNTWSCIEIVADGAKVTAFRGATNKGSFPSSEALTSAELGISTTLSGKVFYYDDVVLAPAAIGCLH